MQCNIHPGKTAVGSCIACGKAICEECAVDIEGKLTCRSCLAKGVARPLDPGYKDPNTAFILELIGGFFGLLGLGYLFVGKTNDGIIRLISWILYNITMWIIISLLITVVVGCVCAPIQLAVQIAVPIWSANKLKNELLNQ